MKALITKLFCKRIGSGKSSRCCRKASLEGHGHGHRHGHGQEEACKESARTAVAFTATAPLKDIGQRLVLTLTLPGLGHDYQSASLCLAFNASMNYYSSSVNKYLISLGRYKAEEGVWEIKA